MRRMRRRCGESPPEEAYGRVTNPERFRVLHSTMLQLLTRLEADFDVQREEGYGLDEELERHFVLARPGVRLTPGDPEAAPLAVAFSDFPGLHLRFGLWWQELLPVCGCDACGDSGEELAERLTRLIEGVTDGRFWECYSPLSNWPGGKIWGSWGGSGHGECSASGLPLQRKNWLKRKLGGRTALDSPQHRHVNWKPWPRRIGPTTAAI